MRLGDRTGGLGGRGLVFCYPHPQAPERLLVVMDGLLYGTHLPINHKWDLVPDLLVFAGSAGPDGCNDPVVAAFFDSAWQVAADLVWRYADR